MKANRAFRLIVTRGGHEPAAIADPTRHDRIEVVAIEDGEPMLYWDLPPREAARLVRELRADLASMQTEEFAALWQGADER